MFKKITFPNGLRAVVVPQEAAQAVTVLVLVGTGSKYETKQTSGISHFLEHLLFKGTKRRPSALAVAETLDRAGGMYNAFTSEEYTGYFAKVKAEHLDLALDWVSDIFINSKLESEEIEREKGVIMEEINMRFDNPMSYVGILWHKLLYGDQPAGWDIAGSKENIAAVNRRKLINYSKSQYVASNTLICLAGKLESSQIVNKVKKYFCEIKTGAPLSKPRVIEKQTEPQCLLRERKTDQTHLCFGARGYNFFHPKKYAQEILAAILGGMMSSRLFIKVRERLGLAYYIKTDVASDSDTGYLVTQAGVTHGKIEQAISVVLEEYQKISQKKVPQKELEKAKDFFKGKMALLLEASDAQASFYGLQELLEKKILTPKQVYAKINEISAEDVLEAARDIFQPHKLNLALIGPFAKKARFQKLLCRTKNH